MCGPTDGLAASKAGIGEIQIYSYIRIDRPQREKSIHGGVMAGHGGPHNRLHFLGAGGFSSNRYRERRRYEAGGYQRVMEPVSPPSFRVSRFFRGGPIDTNVAVKLMRYDS